MPVGAEKLLHWRKLSDLRITRAEGPSEQVLVQSPLRILSPPPTPGQTGSKFRRSCWFSGFQVVAVPSPAPKDFRNIWVVTMQGNIECGHTPESVLTDTERSFPKCHSSFYLKQLISFIHLGQKRNIIFREALHPALVHPSSEEAEIWAPWLPLSTPPSGRWKQQEQRWWVLFTEPLPWPGPGLRALHTFTESAQGPW